MTNKNSRIPDPNEFVSNPGERFENQYSAKVMPDGTIRLEVSGKIDLQEMYDSQAPLTDMNYIIQQLQSGNTVVINPGPFFYGDTTVIPKTYAECLQLRIDAEDAWSKLPLETRRQFDNDFNVYFASAGTPEWMTKMGFDQQIEDAASEKSEVTSDEP